VRAPPPGWCAFIHASMLAAAAALAEERAASALPLRRAVEGQTIISRDTPAIRIRFPPAFRHVGGDRFVLYGMADAELHLFVDAGPDGRVRRMYWVQFEGYLPDNAYQHRYHDPVVAISGLEFFSRASVGSAAKKPRTGSDSERARRLLQAHGYALPPSYVSERLVHLTDASKRNELMIIYAEDAAPLGISAADVKEDGTTRTGWQKLSAELLRRARASFEIQP